jgi:hypothetical protein
LGFEESSRSLQDYLTESLPLSTIATYRDPRTNYRLSKTQFARFVVRSNPELFPVMDAYSREGLLLYALADNSMVYGKNAILHEHRNNDFPGLRELMEKIAPALQECSPKGIPAIIPVEPAPVDPLVQQQATFIDAQMTISLYARIPQTNFSKQRLLVLSRIESITNLEREYLRQLLIRHNIPYKHRDFPGEEIADAAKLIPAMYGIRLKATHVVPLYVDFLRANPVAANLADRERAVVFSH